MAEVRDTLRNYVSTFYFVAEVTDKTVDKLKTKR